VYYKSLNLTINTLRCYKCCKNVTEKLQEPR
jgi:hypothetical protein